MQLLKQSGFNGYGKTSQAFIRNQQNRVRAFFDTITDKEVTAQKRYWILKYPQSQREIRNRWMFAYASVHTSWENNVSQC